MEINHHLILVCSPPSLVKFSCTEMDLIRKKHHNWLLKKSVRIFTSLWYLYNAGDEKKNNTKRAWFYTQAMVIMLCGSSFCLHLYLLEGLTETHKNHQVFKDMNSRKVFAMRVAVLCLFCLSCRIYFLSDLFSILTYTSNCNWRIPAQKFTYV